MSVAGAIRRMLAAGLSIEHALIAVEIFDDRAPAGDPSGPVEPDDRSGRAREQARARKAAQRERNRAARDQRDMSRPVTGVTRDQRDGRDTPPSPSLSPQTPQTHPHPPEENLPAREGRSSSAKNGTRVDGFEPDIEAAVALGLSADRARRQAAQFVDYWRAKPGRDGRKADWPATWRNWVRGQIDRNGPGDGNLRFVPGHSPPPVRGTDAMLDTIRRMRGDPEDAPTHPEDAQPGRTIDGFATRTG